MSFSFHMIPTGCQLVILVEMVPLHSSNKIRLIPRKSDKDGYKVLKGTLTTLARKVNLCMEILHNSTQKIHSLTLKFLQTPNKFSISRRGRSKGGD